MTQQSEHRPQVSGDPIEQDANALERKFGEHATTYAENRSEAAELRGADADAEHWREVAEEIVEDQSDN
jgi:hypothetical protein